MCEAENEFTVSSRDAPMFSWLCGERRENEVSFIALGGLELFLSLLLLLEEGVFFSDLGPQSSRVEGSQGFFWVL